MKIKSFTALFALMMIGLLVITGCNGVFEPPAKPAADGTGTLYVSVDGNGRTILPTASLDKYVLTITDGTSTVVFEDTVSGGGTGVVLSAGTYDLHIDGYKGIDADDDGVIADGEYVLIAEGDTSATVIASETVSASIALTPSVGANGDKGYFEWDFSTVLFNSITVKIYDADDDPATATEVEESTEETLKVELDIGQYSVEFTVVTDEDTYVWREILYVFAGLTSTYGPAQFAQSSTAFTQAYVVPADGFGYFYLDLNDWKTVPQGAPPPVTSGRTLASKLDVTYTANAQRIGIGLTPAQQEAMTSAKYVTVTIEGSATPSATAFRFFIGDVTSGSNWNATADAHAGAISGILNAAKGTAFNANKNANTVKYLVLQQQTAATTSLSISSIKIEYLPELPTTISGYFDLDLTKVNEAYDGGAITSGAGTLGTATVTNGVISVDDLVASGRIAVPLSDEQIEILIGDEAGEPKVYGVKNVFITVWGNGDSDTASAFRYHLGDVVAGGNWNITSATNNNAYGALTTLMASPYGKTQTLGISNVDRIATGGWWILQAQRDAGAATGTVTISKIRVYYQFKNPCRCELEPGFDCSSDPFMAGCTGDCGCTPNVGTDITDTFAIDGLTKAGNPKISQLADGGLFVHSRTNDYSTIDLNVVSTAGTVNADQIGLDPAKYYRFKVTGQALAGSGSAQINRTDRPYSGNTYAETAITGTAGEVVNFTVELASKLASDIFYSENADGVDTTATAPNKIRFRVHSATNPSFVIDTIEIWELDGDGGDPVGTALLDLEF